MRAAQLNENNIVVNTPVSVNALGDLPRLAPAKGANNYIGQVGDLWDGVNFIAPNASSPAAIARNNDAIDAKIAQLESAMTLRRIREAMVTGDKTFLAAMDSQIAALRAQRQ